MKKLIAMAVAILLTACITVFASGTNHGAKQFDYQVPFSKIVVSDDINLLLKESDSKIIDVMGEDADVEKVDWEIKGDVLYLKSKKRSLKDKVVVSVNVSGLKEIIIKGQSIVSSAGTLSSPGIKVYMNGNCYVALKNAGQINIVNSDDIEVEVKRIIGDVQVAS